MKEVSVLLQVNILMTLDECATVEDVVNELNYSFSDTTSHAEIIDTSIEDFEVNKDSLKQ